MRCTANEFNITLTSLDPFGNLFGIAANFNQSIPLIFGIHATLQFLLELVSAFQRQDSITSSKLRQIPPFYYHEERNPKLVKMRTQLLITRLVPRFQN